MNRNLNLNARRIVQKEIVQRSAQMLNLATTLFNRSALCKWILFKPYSLSIEEQRKKEKFKGIELQERALKRIMSILSMQCHEQEQFQEAIETESERELMKK